MSRHTGLMELVVTGLVAVGVLTVAVDAWLNHRKPPPAPSPVIDVATVQTMIEANARIMQEMFQRGLESVVTSMERATYGPIVTPEPPLVRDSDGGPDKWDEPPWANWPADGDVTEPSDASVPEWADLAGPRAVSVRKLPDLTGEGDI